MDITPAQCRAARGLADLTQEQLAKLSRVSKRTITSFEAGQGSPIPSTLASIQRALESAGVEFDATGGVRPKAREAEQPVS